MGERRGRLFAGEVGDAVPVRGRRGGGVGAGAIGEGAGDRVVAGERGERIRRRGEASGAKGLERLREWGELRRAGGVVTLIENGPILVLPREPKSLKRHIATIGESPRFRCESD